MKGEIGRAWSSAEKASDYGLKMPELTHNFISFKHQKFDHFIRNVFEILLFNFITFTTKKSKEKILKFVRPK